MYLSVFVRVYNYQKSEEEKVEPIKRSRETAVNRSDYGGLRILYTEYLNCHMFVLSVIATRLVVKGESGV